jgi:hypothetical protein
MRPPPVFAGLIFVLCAPHLPAPAAENAPRQGAEERFKQLDKAPGLPYISLADVDNDGLLDVLAVGPATGFPGWAPRAEVVGGRFWRNLGGFRFEERTGAAGLEALTWTC